MVSIYWKHNVFPYEGLQTYRKREISDTPANKPARKKIVAAWTSTIQA